MPYRLGMVMPKQLSVPVPKDEEEPKRIIKEAYRGAIGRVRCMNRHFTIFTIFSLRRCHYDN